MNKNKAKSPGRFCDAFSVHARALKTSPGLTNDLDGKCILLMSLKTSKRWSKKALVPETPNP